MNLQPSSRQRFAGDQILPLSLPHRLATGLRSPPPPRPSNISLASSSLVHQRSLSLLRRSSPPPLLAYSGDKDFAAAESPSPAKALRRLLKSPGIYQGPACFDALSAKLVESAGFSFCFTSGFSISAARLGLPDTGLISYGEMVEQGRLITEAVSIPVIGDGDNGYGNALNVKRTVKGYIRAGFAGIILEDQEKGSSFLVALTVLASNNSVMLAFS